MEFILLQRKCKMASDLVMLNKPLLDSSCQSNSQLREDLSHHCLFIYFLNGWLYKADVAKAADRC